MFLYPYIQNYAELSNTTNGTCQDQEGTPVHWISEIFNECVYNTKEEIGFILGLISICCWICSSVPQLVENYKKKKLEEALSFWFLLLWLFGDSSNLIGCALTHQFPIQLYTAVYYVTMDVIMILQYLYYYFKHRTAYSALLNDTVLVDDENGEHRQNKVNSSTVNPNHVIKAIFLMCFIPMPIMKYYSFQNPSVQYSTGAETWRQRNLLSIEYKKATPMIPDNPEEIIGYAIGCISSLFYLGSRLPQILKNLRRKGTDGVSLYMFFLAVFGNLLYGTSILLQDPSNDETRIELFIRHLPWLIGSLGTMSLDFTIMGQIIYYNKMGNKCCCNKKVISDLDGEPLAIA